MRQVSNSVIMLVMALLLQAAVVPHIAIMGIRPDIVLIFIVLSGFAEGSVKGSALGFTGGLFQDILSGQAVGLSAFSKAIVGYISGMVERTIFIDNVLLPMGAIFVASALNDITYAGFNFLLGETIGLEKLLLNIALPTALYNALAMPLVYLIYHKFAGLRPERPSLGKIWMDKQ